MHYQIIARKYRPKNFSEIIGQEKIVTILQNALKKDRIGQAYLFSGPRGVGKTTMARILVKYLNCEAESGIIPCNQCSSCDDINRGKSLDYLEIDGASNRGIDQIRALNEQLAFASPTGKFRVFVIDEVHMLTNEAFNALLKSLEEPPAKFIFILCTTENYKIPLTIRSRCQQLFFTNIDITQIEKHLESILTQEDIPFAPNSLWSLARNSEGSIRDAENLAEKVIAFNSSPCITFDLVQEVLGETPMDKKYLFLIQLANQDLQKNHRLISQLTAGGYNLNEFFHNILTILSDLVYFKSGIHTSEELKLSQEEVDQLKNIEKFFSLGEIFTLSDIIFEFIHTLKNTTHASTITQFFLIKLHRYKQIITPGELKENILKLSQYTIPDENLDTHQPESETNQLESPSVHIHPNEEVPTPPKTNPSNQASRHDALLNISTPKVTENLSEKKSASLVSADPPKDGKNWNKEDYQNLLQILKDRDIELFRMASAFQFLKHENNQLVLENTENLTSERIEIFQKKLKEFLTVYHSEPWLKEYLPYSLEQFRIDIKGNLVERNLEKIKEIFHDNIVEE